MQELCLNVIIPLSIIVCCLVNQKRILSKAKWVPQVVVREATAPLAPRSNGTDGIANIINVRVANKNRD